MSSAVNERYGWHVNCFLVIKCCLVDFMEVTKISLVQNFNKVLKKNQKMCCFFSPQNTLFLIFLHLVLVCSSEITEIVPHIERKNLDKEIDWSVISSISHTLPGYIG